ncbi:MAG: alpha-ketoglutarate-dependent dioxygenase AlkB [Rhodanobacter sp.]|nr:MAG: alpha-ketoglutarate-dependent dioxygenase AlkB [Rhodanobacter sp.]
MGLARTHYPACLKRHLQLEDTSTPYTTTGSVVLASDEARLVVTGKASFVLERQTKLVEALDDASFRAWLTFGATGDGLPEPPTKVRAPSGRPPQSKRARIPGQTLTASAPPGLEVIPEYISALEEKELLAAVDSALWLTDLRRRVQHYGWKYDYKAREVTRASYLGPLPPWAAKLAQRLLREGLMPELPDQVIVNDYQANQGISKHVDCKDCFRGPIITISLLESWGMVFRSPRGEKHEEILMRRSAAVLDGPSRNVWTHEIPLRKKEKSGLRGRRVSLTFRKVNLSEA